MPVSVIKETILTYNIDTANDVGDSGFDWMFASAEDYLKSNMVAGEIIRKNIFTKQNEDIYSLNAGYVCNEVIGQVRIEEIGENNGERNS